MRGSRLLELAPLMFHEFTDKSRERLVAARGSVEPPRARSKSNGCSVLTTRYSTSGRSRPSVTWQVTGRENGAKGEEKAGPPGAAD